MPFLEEIGNTEVTPNRGRRKEPSIVESFNADWEAMLKGETPQPKVDGKNPPVTPIKQGNLDPYNRKVLKNPDGSISTTSSISIGTDDGEVLIPTVVNGKRLSNQDAIARYKTTGENLGVFDTPEHADSYAQWLHEQQASRMSPEPETGNPKPGSLLQKIAMVSSHKQPLAQVIAQHAPKGIPRGTFSTEAPRGFQPAAKKFAEETLIPQSESTEAKGWEKQKNLSEAMAKAGDLAMPAGGLLFKIAGINPATGFAVRAGVEAVNAGLANVPSKLAPEAYGAIKEGMGTGNQSGDFLADMAGQTIGTVKGALPAIGKLAPGAGAGGQFALLGAPGHIVDVAKGNESIPQALESEAISYGSGKALEGAARLGESMKALDAPSKAVEASTAALLQAPVGAAENIAESAVHGQPVDVNSALQSAATYGAFGAHGALKAHVDAQAHEAATSPTNDLPEPTPLQVQSGNYKKGHVNVAGFDISVENPQGSVRKGIGADGTPWETQLKDHYGYIKGSSGADGDHLDAFIGPDPESKKVFVVDQIDHTDENKSFDEHKVVLGANSPEEAKEIYKRNFSDDAEPRIGAITETTPEELKSWIKDGNPREPFAEAKSLQLTANSEENGTALSTQHSELPATPERGQSTGSGEEYFNGGGQKATPDNARPIDTGDRILESQPQSTSPASEGTGVEESDGSKIYGKETSVITASGKQPARYVVTEADDLHTSHDPLKNFTRDPEWNVSEGEVKNTRPYESSKEEQLKVQNIASGLRPEEVINTSPGSTEGTPVIDRNGIAAGGNGRGMGIKLAYKLHPQMGEAYKQHIIDEARSFGIDPEKVQAMKNPVISRELTDVDLPSMEKTAAGRLVDDLNNGPSQSLDPVSEAFKNAKRFDNVQIDQIISVIGDHDTINDAVRSPGVTKNLVGLMEKAGIIDSRNKPSLMTDGKLNDKGANIIRDMLLAKVMPDEETLRNIPDSVKNRIAKAVPSLLAVEHSAIPEWSLRQDMKAAIEYKMRLDDFVYGKKGTAEEFRSQDDAFATPLSPKQKEIEKLLTNRGRGADKAFREVMAEYANGAKNAIGMRDQEAMFTEQKNPSPEDIMAKAAKVAAGETGVAGAGTLSSEAFPGASLVAKAFEDSYEKDIKPALISAAKGVVEFADDIQKTFAPTTRGEAAKETKLTWRDHIADLARRHDIAEKSLENARKSLDGLSQEAKYQFFDRAERGLAQQTPELDAIAAIVPPIFAERIDKIHAFAPGKLRDLYEHYMPHIWEDPRKAEKVFAQVFSRRPIEGSKNFMKERTYDYFSEGIAAGLKPVSDNPIDLVLLKAHEMDRFIMAHEALNEMKERSLLKYVSTEQKAPYGYEKINDKVSTAYGNPDIPVGEYFDKVVTESLNKVAKDLGIDTERKMKIGGKRLGYSVQGGNLVVTKFATPDSVLAHEIGHQLDHKYGLREKFVKNPKTKKELRDLVDQVWGKDLGGDAPEHFKKYVRKGTEKMAIMLESYIHAPELFKQKAPNTYAMFDEFLKSTPELKPLSEIHPSLMLGGGSSTVNAGGMVIKGYWYAPEEAARIVNNYLSPGLREGRFGGAFKGIMGISNVLNQAQLGLSAFHLGFVTVDSMTSGLALGIYEAAHGDILQGAKTAAKSATAPITNLIVGNKVLKEWFAPGSQGEEIGLIANAMQMGGGRAKMDSFYQTSVTKKFIETFRHGTAIGKIFNLARAPFAAVETMAKPIMEYVVPRMKAGAFANMARFELERNQATLDAMDPMQRSQRVRELMSNAWDSVDNRLGQLVYDNLFWDKAAKDLAMASVRSVGWNLGTFRELGGGLIDFVKAGTKIATGHAKDAEFTHRMSYVIAAPVVAGMIGGFLNFIMTGEMPKDLEDYFFPKTGGKDEQGNAARVSLPSYMKDVFAYETDISDAFMLHDGKKAFRTILNKANPTIGLVSEMLSNKDYYGQKIVGDDDNFLLKLAEQTGLAFTPFGVRGLLRNIANEGMSAKATLPFIGITPAPKELNQTHASKLVQEYLDSQKKIEGYEPSERNDYKRKAIAAFRSGKAGEARKIIREGVMKGILVSKVNKDGEHTTDDIGDIQKQAKFDHNQWAVKMHLDHNQALDVYEAATPGERRKLKAIVRDKFLAVDKEGEVKYDEDGNIKLKPSVEDLTPGKKRDAMARFRAAMKLPVAR